MAHYSHSADSALDPAANVTDDRTLLEELAMECAHGHKIVCDMSTAAYSALHECGVEADYRMVYACALCLLLVIGWANFRAVTTGLCSVARAARMLLPHTRPLASSAPPIINSRGPRDVSGLVVLEQRFLDGSGEDEALGRVIVRLKARTETSIRTVPASQVGPAPTSACSSSS